MKIILATYNDHKVREISGIIAPIEVTSLSRLGVELNFDDVEDGETYAENALKKVVAASRHVDGIIVADDSGLEVDALGGRPGIHSSRFGGPGISDAGRCELLLEEMEDVPGDKRGARFVCCVAVRFPSGRESVFNGELHGVISSEMIGEGGFGYDPVVYLPDLGLSVAELSPDEKNRISHRAVAFAAMREALLNEES